MPRSSFLLQDLPGALALAAALAGIIAMAAPDRCGAQNVDADKSHRRIQPLPALGSAPETGLQYGATVLAVWQPAPRLQTRPSSVLAFALRTGRGQTRIGVETDRWTTSNARRLAVSLFWQEYPLPFYGMGDRSRDEDKITFTPSGLSASATVQERLRGSLYATGSVAFSDQRIAADSMGQSRLAGLTGAAGGQTLEWTLGLLNDTRDHLYAPGRGHLVQVGYTRSTPQIVSDFRYGRLRLDARGYRDLGRSNVLAAHVLVVAVDGQAPFDRLALVGGSDIMRGYALGRYRSRSLAAAQAEYRSPLSHRLGAVLFAGAGISGVGTTALAQQAVLSTYGAGVRFQIDSVQRTSVRADYGRGRDGAAGLYIGFNQAF